MHLGCFLLYRYVPGNNLKKVPVPGVIGTHKQTKEHIKKNILLSIFDIFQSEY